MWTGPVVGLAVSGLGVWASDPTGQVVRLAALSPHTGAPLSTGRLAWWNKQLLIGDRGGWVHIAPTESRRTTRCIDSVDRAVLAVIDRTDPNSGRAQVAAVNRDGRLRFDEVGPEGVTETSRYRLPDPIAEACPNPDGSVNVWVAGPIPNGRRFIWNETDCREAGSGTGQPPAPSTGT